jgi:uracil-DNA glycosylase family 4
VTVGGSNQLSVYQRRALHAMDIQVWSDREASADLSSMQVDSPPPVQAGEPVTGDWGSLEHTVSTCVRCVLHQSRTQTVFGVGHARADWLIIGEAPGADEDRLGEPFVGRAGQLLNEMLRAVGLARTDVYITNILKCRPPNNRHPKPDEVASCSGYLQRQIEIIQPQLILAVGAVAAQNLLGSDTPVGQLRGIVHRYGDAGIPLVVTYHPAYLLRSPAQKAKAWDDLCLAKGLTDSSPDHQ